MRHDNPALYPDCFKMYVTESGRVRTASTEEAFKIHLRALQYVHPGKGVRDFTVDDLTEYCLSKGAAPKTQTTRRSLLHSFFVWAAFKGLVKDDPSRDLRFTVQPGTRGVRSHTWLSAGEFVRLLSEVPKDTLVERRDRMVVFVAALVGIRRSSLATLRWSMFSQDLSEVKLIVKGQKLKEFGIPDVLQEALRVWRHELAPHQGADGPLFPTFQPQMSADGSGYEMACRWNVALEHGGIGIAVARAGRKVFPGKPKLCPHDLRRSYAGYLEAEGFELKDIMLALGHENLATTSIYLDRNPAKAVAVGRGLRIKLDG